MLCPSCVTYVFNIVDAMDTAGGSISPPFFSEDTGRGPLETVMVTTKWARNFVAMFE